MIEPTCSRRDAVGVIFNLPGYHVIDAVDLPSGGRRVIVHACSVELIVVKPRLVCAEPVCSRRMFTQAIPELPFWARCMS